MTGEELQQLKDFVMQQVQTGANETELREVLKKEGGWSEADLDLVFQTSYTQEHPPVGLEQTADDSQTAPATPPVPTENPPATPSQPTASEVSSPTSASLEVTRPETEPQSHPQTTTSQPSSSAPVSHSQSQSGVQSAPESGVMPQQPVGNQTVPPAEMMQNAPTQQDVHAGGKKLGKIVTFSGVAILVLLFGGGVAYMFTEGVGFFSNAPYTQENLFSGIRLAMQDVETVTYTATASFEMQEREEGVKAFSVPETENGNALMYERDKQRLADVQAILRVQWFSSKYATTLNELLTEAEVSGTYNGETSSVDPLTGHEYEYTVLENGDNFKLIVTFETDEAIDAIRDSIEMNRNSIDFDESNTVVDGNSVTFTKKSDSFIYLPNLPKPFFVELSDQLRMMPPDMSTAISFKASSDLRVEGIGDWDVSIDAEADMQGMSFDVGLDGKHTDDDYYFKIRSFPSFFIGPYASIFGKWIRVSPSDLSADSEYFSNYSSMMEDLSEFEREFKQNRAEFSEELQKILEAMDSLQLFKIQSKPTLVTRDERDLYLYDMLINKEAVMGSAEDVAQYLEEKGESVEELEIKEYFESEEFEVVLDYLIENLTFEIYVDKKGRLADVEVGLRIIPPDTAEQLLDKQGYISFVVKWEDINEDLNITAPESSISIEEAMRTMEEEFDSMYGY